MSFSYGYDYEKMPESGVVGEIVTVTTGSDKAAARRGAVRESVKHGSAALLVYGPDGGDPVGAVTYVDGRFASRDGVTQ